MRRSLIALLAAGVAPAGWAAWPPPVPPTLDLTVRETAGVARAGEIVQTGLPLPRALGVTDTADLAVVDAGGIPVPAEFRVLGRWHAALSDEAAPIQWVLVAFPATVPAGGSAGFRLVSDGSVANPPPAVSLVVDQVGDQVTVATGAATFVLGGSAGALFDEARDAAGQVVASGGALTARTGGTTYAHPTLRAVTVEHAGPLTAVVTVEGAYAAPAVGGGALASFRRYVFRAGSPTAVVRQALTWEGDRCGLGTIFCGGAPNGRLLERWRDTLDLAAGGATLDVTVGAARGVAPAAATVAAGQSAALRQRRRAERLDPRRYEIELPGQPMASGIDADRGWLFARWAGGAVAVGLARLHRYEPGALRVLADGDLALDPGDDEFWVGPRQGMLATLGVTALPATAAPLDADALLWAPLNAPLLAWPEPEWWAASEAVKEFPVGPLAPPVAAYDGIVSSVLQLTLDEAVARGLPGLETFGLYPRIWGNPIYTDEIDTGCDGDTALTWDDPYWCATWTDYHDTVATAPLWAMRSGEVEWLHDLAFPGALRSLHTVAFQCAPGDPFFYCGMAPTGYGGYRSDNNASHQYFENLALYYWLTGDETVLRVLDRAARTMRAYMCPSRAGSPPGPPCAPGELPADDWAALNGRSAVQWQRVFRLLGLALDAEYLTDWANATERSLTLYHAEPAPQPAPPGAPHAFMSSFNGSLTTDYVSGPGAWWSDQLWTLALYDFDQLWRLGVDRGNAPLGLPPLAPSATLGAWGRTLRAVSTLSPWSDGGPGAPWPNAVRYTFSGPRVGGALVDLEEAIDGDGDGTPCEICGDDDGGQCFDLCLYNTGKAALTGCLWRAADATGDPAQRALAEAFTAFTLDVVGQDLQPLGKFMGEYLGQLHVAVARWQQELAPQAPIFADGFETGDTQA